MKKELLRERQKGVLVGVFIAVCFYVLARIFCGCAQEPPRDSYWTIMVTNKNVWYNNTFPKLDPIVEAMAMDEARTRPYWIELPDPPRTMTRVYFAYGPIDRLFDWPPP